MAPRSSWKGFLKLSLVSVPVKAFTANNTSEEVRLNQLHKECNSRVKYKKVCLEHGELESKDIVSGYEYAKDQYVVIDPQELSKLRAESDRSVRIEGFLPPEEIDGVQFAGKAYFLLPDGVAGHKPYALLHRGMLESGVVALGQIILSGREQLVLVRPIENLLMLSVLHYAKKIKSIDEFAGEFEADELTKQELELTNTLITASRIEEFDLASYTDGYVENLTKLIQMKIDGKEVVQAPDLEEPKILNLMEALKKSVAEAQAASATPSVASAKSKTKKKVAKKKVAPSAAKKKSVRKKKSG